MATGARAGKTRGIGKKRRPPLVVLPAVLSLLVLAGLLLWLYGGAAQRGAAEVGGPFRLVSGSGNVVTERSFPGRYLLIYFGYTSCPDICPTTLADITLALARLGPRAAQVQALFITVDPQHDTPALLEKYVARFSPSIVGLTGSSAEISEVEKEYRVSVAMVPTQGGGYSIDHTAALYLMAPDGRFVTALRAGEGGDALAAAIEKIIS
jgi:protein SCO1